METVMKRCPKCSKTKALGEFSPGNSRCKQCKTEQATAKYWANAEYREQRKAYHKTHEREKRADPEKNAVILEKLRVKRLTNPEWKRRADATKTTHRRANLGSYLSLRARVRAKARGIPCTITQEWTQQLWEANPTCAYCARKLRTARDHHAYDSASLDRVDATKGYTPENTVFACWRCNTLKRDATVDELERLAANVRRVIDARTA